jgi:hypothetical protein
MIWSNDYKFLAQLPIVQLSHANDDIKGQSRFDLLYFFLNLLLASLAKLGVKLQHTTRVC